MNRFEFYSNIAKYEKEKTLTHYGITGQKWGVRHWQYADGRFTPEGKERYFGSKGNKESAGDDVKDKMD